MDRIRIKGGKQLKGEIVVSGSKNACLPLMVAAMLTDKPLVQKNVPRLADITTMIALLRQHGVEIEAAPGENGHRHGTTLTLKAGRITSTTGTSYRSRASRRTAALAELQAITSILTPWSTRWSKHSRAYSRTSPMALGP